MKTIMLLTAAFAGSIGLALAAPLGEMTVTEVVRSVDIVGASANTGTAAQSGTVVHAADLVRTGADSRTEITSADQTVLRAGANTVISHDGASAFQFLQGSLLLNAAKAVGGATIQSGGASATVSGTAIAVSTPNGGFKVIVLEGSGRVTLASGRSVSLRAGQMVYLIEEGRRFSPVFDVDLPRLIEASLLVRGFAKPLPSVPQIEAALLKQGEEMKRGRTSSGNTAEDFANTRRLRMADDIQMTTAVNGGLKTN